MSTNGLPPEEGDGIVEVLDTHCDAIIRRESEIEQALETVMIDQSAVGEFDTAFSHVMLALHGEVERSDQEEVATALLNLILNFSRNMLDKIEEEIENGDKIAKFIRRWNLRYAIKLEQMTGYHYRGPNSWTNINTEKSIRSSEPVFHHEFTRLYQDRICISSSASGVISVANHMVVQILDARGELGQDVLNYVDKDSVEELSSNIEELEEALVSYKEEYEGSKTRDDPQNGTAETDNHSLDP